jgi:GT2 family glycosyltransferase
MLTSFRPRVATVDEPTEGDLPVKVLELELSHPLEPVTLQAADPERSYARALCLVRLHGHPLGLVRLRPEPSQTRASRELGTDTVARQIWAELEGQIRRHLVADGLPAPESLPAEGLRPVTKPHCLAAREAVRARARPASVVVATRERPAALSRCLESLMGLDYPAYEILVVDNAPRTSATRELLATDPFRGRVKYIREPQPGLAAAHNRGLREVSGAFVAFTDDDVTVDRLWLSELARGFELADGVGCVTGLIGPAELETRAQLVAEQLWGFNKGFSVQVFDRQTDRGDPLYPYTAGTFGSGANMAFDTAVLRSLGGFDPATGAGTLARGGDDLCAFFRVVSDGYRLVYNPASLVLHAHHADYAALERQAYGYGVGLTAFLTKTVVDRPGRILELARLSRHGVARVLDPRSGKASTNSGGEQIATPAGLARAERRGMLHGPFAYLRSRRRIRLDG